MGFTRGALATALALLVAPRASANTSINFPIGSLIIPTGASFQDDCGAVSAYGLVYDILRANAWLDTQSGLHHVTVYYAYDDSKKSPNRCPPTNLDTTPKSDTSSSYPSCSSTSCKTDPSWSDGCDFSISGAQPVLLVANTSHTGPDTSVVTRTTTSQTDVSPGYTGRTISSSVTKISYLGGPFVISSSNGDDQIVRKLLDRTIVAYDSSNNVIDFTPFTSSTACTGLGSAHHVNIHRATAAFTASVGKQFVSTPPRLALLATDNTVAGSSRGCGVGTGLEYDGTSSGTGKVCNGILETYLASAGLNFAGAAGCPAGGANVGTSLCPSPNATGQIYDVLDFADIYSGKLALTDSNGNLLYRMLWTPHWESRSTGSSAPTSRETTAFTNIGNFLNQSTGLAAECASISTYEGAYTGGSPDIRTGLQLQTCTSSTCGSATYGIDRNPSAEPSGVNGGYLLNCSDPSVTSGQCAYFGYPGDPYLQTGDHIWNLDTGHVTGFETLSSTLYKPGVIALLSAVASVDKTKLSSPSAARSIIKADLASRSIKDNTSGKANILYMSGHDQTANVAGTKVMLETLLQLGFTNVSTPATTTEVSRATPIVATIEGNVDTVQGTFESVTGGASVTTVAAPADLSAFTFPFVHGHMRAHRTSGSGGITSAATAFSAGTVDFDAAALLPAVSSTGSCSAFDGTCRTVFTNDPAATPVTGTGTTQRPSNVFLSDTNASALGPYMGISAPAFTTANQITFIHRVLAGVPNGAGGYAATLGGVDRSTVAVIGASTIVSGAGSRAAIAYFGATDGMLHAVCADNTHAPCTGKLGTELWAFLPRVQLPKLRTNTTRIDGSPRVVDLFGDFGGTGLRSYRTVLFFQTGSGDASTSGATPAVYALDISTPTAPTVMWEYTLASAPSTNQFDLGQGEALAAGMVAVNGANKPVVFAETNNGGNGGSGVVVNAIDAALGTKVWQFGQLYTPLHSVGDAAVPATGIPGGAVGIDKNGTGLFSDVIFGDLFGRLWVVDPATGTSRYNSTGPSAAPLFSFSSDYHPIGSLPAVYSNANVLYAFVTSGGYADASSSPTSWNGTASAVQQYGVAVRLSPTTGVPPSLSQTSGSPNIPIVVTFSGTGERSFSQATIVGTQIFLTTDTADVNASTYGTTGSTTGHVYTADIGTGLSTYVTAASGASSIGNNGTTLYASSGQSQQQVTTAAGTTGPIVNNMSAAKLTRKLWLRTQ